jgi:hypothetical protein
MSVATKRFLCGLTLVGLGSLALPLGCGTTEDKPMLDAAVTSSGSSGASSSGGFSSSGKLGDIDAASPPTAYASLRIDPADAVIDVEVGKAPPSRAYKVFGKVSSTAKEEEISGAKLSFDRPDAASFVAASLTPTGLLGGKGLITAKAGASSVQTSATIRLNTTVGTVPAANVLAALNAATAADPSIKVVYPYDKTVFPRGVGGPTMQWTGAAAGESTFRIKATSPTFVMTAYAVSTGVNGEYDFPTTPADVWGRLVDSTVGELAVEVQRYTAGVGYAAVRQSWTIAGASLKGNVYYTRLVNADTFVRRIEPGKAAESFIQKKGESCIACHSVSNNGERIVASVEGGASPWGVWDARTGARLFLSTQASG